ncbi:MAG TPA: hypothetical protein PLB89_04770 [Flavobacteriales bacterium]|nr:hypothetical protein [Flavobacteriales bacterium]
MLSTDFNKPVGNNTPGVVPEIFFAPKSHFLVIATPPAVETVQGEDVIITDSHTFTDPDLGFIRLELTDRTGQITFTQTGELDSESTNAVMEGFASGLNPGLLSFMGKQFDGILLQQDLNCSTPRYYQIGTACSVARKKGFEYTTGIAGGEGRKGMKVRFEAVMEKPLIYTGAVTRATQPVTS